LTWEEVEEEIVNSKEDDEIKAALILLEEHYIESMEMDDKNVTSWKSGSNDSKTNNSTSV